MELSAQTLKTISMGILAILVLMLLLKIYRKWVDKIASEPVFYSKMNVHGFFKDTTKEATISEYKIRPSPYGMEYSYSFWIKIDDFNYLFGKPKHIFHKGPLDISVCNPGVFIAPTKNQLMIRVDTLETSSVYRVGKNRRINDGEPLKTSYDVDLTECKKECSANAECNSFTLDQLANQCTFFSNSLPALGEDGGEFKKYPEEKGIDSFSKQKSMNPDFYDEYELNSNLPCDLVDIPLQRWNHVVIVLWNRSLDVYLNGKLARSCTLRSVPALNNGPLYVNQNGGYKGDMASLKYFNRAINAEEVYKIYRRGPSELNLMKKFIPKINLDVNFDANIDIEKMD